MEYSQMPYRTYWNGKDIYDLNEKEYEEMREYLERTSDEHKD